MILQELLNEAQQLTLQEKLYLASRLLEWAQQQAHSVSISPVEANFEPEKLREQKNSSSTPLLHYLPYTFVEAAGIHFNPDDLDASSPLTAVIYAAIDGHPVTTSQIYSSIKILETFQEPTGEIRFMIECLKYVLSHNQE